MTLYPRNLTKNDRIYDFEVIEELFSSDNFSVYNVRNLNTDMRLFLEIPHSVLGLQYLRRKNNVIGQLSVNNNFRHVIPSTSHSGIFALEPLPSVSFASFLKDNSELGYKKFCDTISQLLYAVEYFYGTFSVFPLICLDNLYFVGSRVIIDYINDVSENEFLHNFAKIILCLSNDKILAEKIVKLLPINFPDFDFKFLKANLISLFGCDYINKATAIDDFTLKCPSCQKEYLINAGICKHCKINLLTGLGVEENQQAKISRKKFNLTWLTILIAFIGIFAVFGSTLGFSWLLWTILSSIAVTTLIVIFVFVFTSG